MDEYERSPDNRKHVPSCLRKRERCPARRAGGEPAGVERHDNVSGNDTECQRKRHDIVSGRHGMSVAAPGRADGDGSRDPACGLAVMAGQATVFTVSGWDYRAWPTMERPQGGRHGLAVRWPSRAPARLPCA